MPAPILTAADFAAALAALMPPGRAWPRDPDSVQSQARAGLAPLIARNNDAANALLQDAFPATSVDLLGEWEESLGLPDPCAGPAPTVLKRREQVLARFAEAGGQSVAFLVAFAAKLGYAITITQFSPWHFGSAFGLPLSGPDWAHAWQVNAPMATVEGFQFGVSVFGEPFASFGNTVLECELARVAPAHTIVIFHYS